AAVLNAATAPAAMTIRKLRTPALPLERISPPAGAGKPGTLELEPVAQVERAVGVRVRVGEEGRVDAVECVAVAVVGALDGELAARDRAAGHLHAPESVAGALGLLEHGHVDLAAEHLVHAAHVATPAALVVEQVEVGAARLDAAGGVHEPVAEGAALPALVCGCALTGCPRHQVSVAAEGRLSGYPHARELLELCAERGAVGDTVVVAAVVVDELLEVLDEVHREVAGHAHRDALRGRRRQRGGIPLRLLHLLVRWLEQLDLLH